MIKLVILISGRGSNLRAIWEFIKTKNLPIQISQVISNNAQAFGLQFCQKTKIKTTVIPYPASELSKQNKQSQQNNFEQQLAQILEAESPDLIVLAGFMRVLSEKFVSKFAGKIINIHPSLLPSFRGRYPQQQALSTGVKITGCTVHYVTAELDGGPIIAQSAVKVLANDTVESLSERILRAEHKLYPQVIAKLARSLLAEKKLALSHSSKSAK